MISELCVHDPDRGTTEVVLRLEGARVEAPNWHPEGALVVNQGGRLFRVPLDAPRLLPVATGFAALNNDHGPSPDGRLLAVSDKAEAGASCIFVLPWPDGAARRATPLAPSWFHAWTPDGAGLLYAAARDGGPVTVASCALDGGGERLLAEGFDHADGPDATPDGAWVWFNGERDGAVDLWRVRPDGTGLERMTEGDTVDWFPHPSPDGRDVLFLSYPPGTRGHPADLPVRLRLVPAEGGRARDLLAFRGGQGSINVPCWEPGGRRLAFARHP